MTWTTRFPVNTLLRYNMIPSEDSEQRSIIKHFQVFVYVFVVAFWQKLECFSIHQALKRSTRFNAEMD
ncbi:MAG: hypothetical protein DSY87_05770 [Methylococcus sp.]|nr:MAG: hypothetical protein DSY87_05770 [Methylococcus sp.]